MNYVLEKEKQPAWVVAGEESGRDEVLDSLWCSPNTGGPLRRENNKIICVESGQEFPITEGIAQLFWPHEQMDSAADMTEKVKAFYEKTLRRQSDSMSLTHQSASSVSNPLLRLPGTFGPPTFSRFHQPMRVCQ